ncbi:MAG: hypothetical protein HC860_16195 [Alkalinema sp. RU_4_3]|nr:hypothetical protein [Alkalinema sp. RU_4_3]
MPQQTLQQCLANLSAPGIKYSSLAPSLKVYPTASDVPWSQALVVRDNFNGSEFVTVRDHHYEQDVIKNRQAGIMSSWGLDTVHFSAYGTTRAGSVQFEAKSATVKVGDRLFQLDKKLESLFSVTPDLANALQSREDVVVRLVLENGRTVTYPIGSGTIKEWSRMLGLFCA